MNISRIVILALVIPVIMICGCKKSSDSGDSSFALQLTPQRAEPDVYEEFTLTLEISDVRDMFVIGFNLLYDHSRLRLSETSTSSGGILGNDIISFTEEINGGIGVSIGRTQSAGDDNVSGSGNICEFTFLAIGMGESQVELNNVTILDEDGSSNTQISESNVVSAEVNVD